MLLRAFWSRWQEEGIAAARLLCDLPQVLQDRLGSHPFAEALEVVDAELKPEELKPWKSPAKRARFLRTLQSELTDAHEHLVKLERAHRKRIAKQIIIKRKAPKIRAAASVSTAKERA